MTKISCCDLFFAHSNNKQLNCSVSLPQHKWSVPVMLLVSHL